MGQWWRRIAFLLRRNNHLQEMEEEMRLHAELRAKMLEQAGRAPESAAIEAKRQFGSRTSFKEAVWDVWSFAWLEGAWRDVKFAFRLLRKDLSFTAVAVTTLALGIGATTVMFSVIDNVLLEPFPYADQQRLVSLVIHDETSRQEGGRMMFPGSEFLDYREQNRSFRRRDGRGHQPRSLDHGCGA